MFGGEGVQVFTEGMGTWWPVREFSRAADQEDVQVKTERVIVEPWVGGPDLRNDVRRLRGKLGHDFLAWEAPHGLVMAWKPNRSELPPTKESRYGFIEQDDGRTSGGPGAPRVGTTGRPREPGARRVRGRLDPRVRGAVRRSGERSDMMDASDFRAAYERFLETADDLLRVHRERRRGLDGRRRWWPTSGRTTG